jgi:hypothetical protein
MNKDYRMGFSDGFKFAQGMIEFPKETFGSFFEPLPPNTPTSYPIPKAKRKVKQTKKQKLLTQMTKKKWDKYKKGRGKKTYVEIRAEVSRSQAYKKACKRL